MPNPSIVAWVFRSFSIDEEVALIVCTLLGWLLFSRLGSFDESRQKDSQQSSVEAQLLLAGDFGADVSCKDEKLQQGRFFPMLRRSILQAVMRRCPMRTRRNLKSWRRVSFCEEVSYRALEPRELSLRQALELQLRERQEQEEEIAQLEEAKTSAMCGSGSSWCAKEEVTEADYKAMVHAAIRAGF